MPLQDEQSRSNKETGQLEKRDLNVDCDNRSIFPGRIGGPKDGLRKSCFELSQDSGE